MWYVWGEKRKAYRILVGKSQRIRPRRGPRLRWKDNIKKDLKEIGWKGVDWITLAQDRDKWRAVMNVGINKLRVPY
jgi:hypothetical protein